MHRFMRYVVALVLLVAFAAAGVAWSPWGEEAWVRLAGQQEMVRGNAIDLSTIQFSPQAVMETYCGGCHTSGRSKIDFDLSVDERTIRRDVATWKLVADKLRTGEMPPRKSVQPSTEDRRQLIAWIEDSITAAQLADHGSVYVRRLRRNEYENSVRDLLGIRVPAEVVLPGDADVDWDRGAEVPDLTPALAKDYGMAAEQLVNSLAAGQVLVAVGFSKVEVASATETASQESDACADRATSQTADDVRQGLAHFARRAYRRPLADREWESLERHLDETWYEGVDVEVGMRAALKAVLTSPHFLHHVETLPETNDASARSGEFALAARLARFLWNSVPDDELLEHAEQATLRDQLQYQVQRMLCDPRARSLALEFVPRWLELSKLSFASKVDEALATSVRLETELFADAIFREDRSVLEFLDSESTFLNERLAHHYGIEGVAGEAMRRVKLPGARRGGLLSQASVLALTSMGVETSPVKRGKWVMGNILGTPPPPPPSGLLEALENTKKKFKPGTARQTLEQHRSNQSCAHCHAKMDTIGVALENLDGLGVWRTSYASQLPIDPLVHFPTGESVNGPAGVRSYLLGERDLFVRCLSEKLLSYALGRKLTQSERADLAAIPPRVAQDDFRFSSVLLEVIQSDAFQSGRVAASMP